jgi:polysaccharide export outer membrane protein
MLAGASVVGCSTEANFLGGEADSPGFPRKAVRGDDEVMPPRTVARSKGNTSGYELVQTGYRPASAMTDEAAPAGPIEEGDGGPRKPPLPRELSKTTLPAYIIEPPDVLFIDAVRIIPKPPYRIEPLDVLLIQVAETLPNQPIAGPFPVSPDGTVNLGYSYGAVRVTGMTLEEAAQNIQTHLKRSLNNPQVAVALAQFRGVQQTRGDHLVQMDGTISLGSYGCVPVTGLTLAQAKCAIEKHLSNWLLNPEISLSVSSFNSKVYYVIIDGGGYGEQVFRLPVTGNETVLDAIGMINGLPTVCSTKRVWVARPTPANHCCYQILPVNWRVMTQAGDTSTNYQLFPGDRVYVKANRLLYFNNRMSQFLYPITNGFGGSLLGAGAVGAVRTGGTGGL